MRYPLGLRLGHAITLPSLDGKGASFAADAGRYQRLLIPEAGYVPALHKKLAASPQEVKWDDTKAAFSSSQRRAQNFRGVVQI